MTRIAPTVSNRLVLQASQGASLTLRAEGNVSLAAAAGDGDSQRVPTFRMNVYNGGIMYPQLSGIDWKGPVVVDIAGMTVDNPIPIHRDHDTTRPVGHGDAQLSNAIVIDGVFSVPGDDTDEIIRSARNGFPWKGSVGLSNMAIQRIGAGQTVQCNGQLFDGPILYVAKSHMDESSFLSIAGDSTSSATIAAQRLQGATDMGFSQWLAARGHDESKLTEGELALLKKTWEAEIAASAADDPDPATDSATDPATDPAPAATDPAPVTATAGRGRGTPSTTNYQAQLSAQRQAMADEEERVTAIRAVGETLGNPTIGNSTLVATAIRDGWTVARATLEASRAARPRAPQVHSTSRNQRGTVESLQAAIMLRAGRSIETVIRHDMAPEWMEQSVDNPDRARIMDQAHEFRDCTMIEMVDLALRASGHEPPSGRSGRSGRLAVLRAGFSTGATQAIFTQSIGAMALGAYQEAGDFSQGWCSETDQLNLMPAERPRMQSAPDLDIHPTGGDANHANRAAVSETIRVDRFSKTGKIDENDFINDQFGLLRDTPTDFGRAAARLRPNLVAAVLLANAALGQDAVALFHASHNNLITGSALAQATLRTARARLGKATDGDASLNLPATHLIVPSDLGDLAVQLTMSAVISNDSGVGGTNPIRTRNIMPIEEARLANGLIDPVSKATLAGSLTSWYLVSAEGKTIEVQYLSGTGRVPIVVVESLIHGEFGLCITVKHFCGAKALDFRSMVRGDA